MRLLLKKNGGLADARNFGIRFARAEWIFPLDSDDIILPDFLEKAGSPPTVVNNRKKIGSVIFASAC
jgi:glycosyltransferase involved in cell wall biosynthesis